MNGWITGFGALKKIDIVKSALYKNRQKKLNMHYGHQAPKFHPIYSSFKFIDNDTRLLVQKIQKFKGTRLFPLEQDYLEVLQELYTNVTNLNLLSPQKDTYSIFVPILKELPEAFDEFNRALYLINNYGSWIADIMNSVLYEVVPLKGRNGDIRAEVGFSDYNLLGSIFTGLYKGPFRIIDLSIAISHEVGHQVLMLQQAGQSPLTEESFSKEIYSGVRKTKRPSIAAFHAIVALVYMNEMYRHLLNNYHFDNFQEKLYTEQKYDENHSNLCDGLRALNEIELTNLGKRIIDDVKSTL